MTDGVKVDVEVRVVVGLVRLVQNGWSYRVTNSGVCTDSVVEVIHVQVMNNIGSVKCC